MKLNMMTVEQMKIIFKSWKLKQVNLFILYDDRQLPPPIKKSLPITTIDKFNEFPIIELTVNYRQTDPELKVILDYYREYSCMEGEILERK